MSELKHYGVLGMKWGVRKDRNKAFTKATKKLRKLDNKFEKKTIVADAKRAKADQKAYKADYSSFNVSGKAKAAAKANKKARKVEYQASKSRAKAMKWYRAMEKTFENYPVSNISNEDVALGKKYADMQIQYLTDRRR